MWDASPVSIEEWQRRIVRELLQEEEEMEEMEKGRWEEGAGAAAEGGCVPRGFGLVGWCVGFV
jgi:hypothetical protein